MLHPAYTDLDLIQMQVEALFVHDASGRLLRINEPEPTSPAPRFYLTRTAQGNLWRTRDDLPAELAAELERLAADEPVAQDLHAPPIHAADYSELLNQHAPIVTVDSGPTYTLPDIRPPHGTLTITPENISVLLPHFNYLHDGLNDYIPVEVVVSDGVAVAACFSSRITPRVCEAGVYVEALHRGRGYAPEIVRGWAISVRALGKIPLYSTSWTNTASQAVARKLGAQQYAVDFSIT